MKSKIVYLAHPIGGDVHQNLAALRKAILNINMNPKYADIVPFVPYYADVVSLNDNIPAQRERGIKNGQELLKRKGMVDEVWLLGKKITPGMQAEVFTAFKQGIPVKAFNSLYNELLELKTQWEKNQ